MADWWTQLQFFHFIRPLWLLALLVILGLWWRIRRRATAAPDQPDGIAPHLARALSVGRSDRLKLLPIDLSAGAMVLLALAAAGPSWSRAPNPLVTQTAPLAIMLEVSESMTLTDIAPSRLERAKQKIVDIIDERAGARTALIAFAGTAHRVVPLTEDPLVIRPFLEGLEPDIMPRDGENVLDALELARTALSAEPTMGAILIITDGLNASDIPALQTHLDEGGAPIVFLAIGADSGALTTLRRLRGAPLVEVAVDRRDVDQVNRRVASAYAAALARDERQSWLDRGWIFGLPAALLCLLWIRRGSTMRWAFAPLLATMLLLPSEAHADGWRDWFFTPDQQGRMAYEDLRFSDAADLFEDPLWKGYALYRSGRYAEVATVLSRVETSEAAFITGMAQIRSREYRPAIASFELAVERDPDNAAAVRNLEIARVVLAYIEMAREQSDTGEESGIGADDVVFDNDDARGAETQIQVETQMTIDTEAQWMRSVDTRTRDFLATRFALEAAGDPG